MAFFRKLPSSAGKVNPVFSVFAVLCLLISILSFHASPAYAATPAEQGRAIFEQKCKACHTIGGGRGVGPDLKGITANRDRDWLIRFITTPDKLIGQGDPISQQIVKEYGLPMPNLGVSNDDAEAILAYIEAQSTEGQPVVTPVTAPTTSSAPTASTTSAPVDADTGKDLFTGRLAFLNGGPSCLSCHNASSVGSLGGGTVGKDLTASYATFGEAGITSILKTVPFPMMKEIYATKPLTEAEISGLLAFLKSAGNSPSAPSQNTSLFFIIGGAVALLIIGLFQWLWRGRLSGVRRTLVKGGSK